MHRRSTASSARTAAGGGGRWLLLVTAVAQAASPSVVGFDQSSVTDPVVVPPDPFFAIWGVVVLGCLTAAVWGLPAARASRAPWRQIQLPVSLVQLGFVVWLVAAARLPLLTLPVFVAMLALLVPSLRTVLRSPADRGTRALLGGTLGLYAGWTAAAVWMNAAALLPGVARGAQGLPSMLVLAALLLGAVVTAAALARLVHARSAWCWPLRGR
jgi:hypothetical protein